MNSKTPAARFDYICHGPRYSHHFAVDGIYDTSRTPVIGEGCGFMVHIFADHGVMLVEAVFCLILALFSECPAQAIYQRGQYPDWKTSQYVLPFPPGTSYRVSQGNFYGGHLTLESGAFRYAYDFEMPIGSTIVAARGGRVVYTRTYFKDGNGGGPVGSDNVVLIDHEDGTYALYGHLTFKGSLVGVGQVVKQGQPIALSGNTGMTGGLPHLHFMVSRCPGGEIPCGVELTSVPVTFRNTRPNPDGLMTNEKYAALGIDTKE